MPRFDPLTGTLPEATPKKTAPVPESKTFRVRKAVIGVNHFSESFRAQQGAKGWTVPEYNFDLKIEGILPGCRKYVRTTEAPYAKAWRFQPLFGYNGRCNITPADFRRIINAATVVKAVNSGEFQLTPELEKAARQFHLERVECPAVTEECAANYQPEYSPVVICMEARTEGARPKPPPPLVHELPPRTSALAVKVAQIPEATFLCLLGSSESRTARKTRVEFALFCNAHPEFSDWREAWRAFRGTPSEKPASPATNIIAMPKPDVRSLLARL